jgi:adenosylhomocysteine nucleosidase
LGSDRAVGVVVGMVAEARIARGLGWMVATGGGTAAGAEAATRRLIDAGADALVSFGLAGGLEPGLRPGALIVPCAVIARGVRYRTDPALSERLGGATGQVVLGANAVVAGVAEKRRLYGEVGAAAVDLESGAVARAATARGMPFAVLRAVCDPVERGLPAAALAALDAHGSIGMGRVIASLVVRPGQVAAVLTLARDAAVARRALRRRVSQISDAGRALRPVATAPR